MARKFCAAVALAAVFCLSARAAWAQELPKFDPSNYASLVDADSTETIPYGTKITLQNWQQYKNFLPPELQWALAGKLPWPKPPSDFVMEIGPNPHIPMPTKYKEDTEKYSSQVKLVKTAAGGYAIDNYTAGLAFPKIDPNDPQVGIKIVYNNYYKYYPWCDYARVPFWLYDRFGNETRTLSHAVWSRAAHLSEPNMPQNRKVGDNYDFTQWVQALVPEQSKYTTLLTIFYDDPGRVEERYAFIPALRRTLRLSASARCAPFQGTDFTNEDARFGFNGQPPMFKVNYLGKKKILFFTDFNAEAQHKIENFWRPMPFPKPAIVKWEPRTMYVIDMERLPAYSAGYCFSHRVIFMDPEDWSPNWILDYDTGGKLWKILFIGYRPTKTPDGTIFEGWVGNVIAPGYDVQVMHSTLDLHFEPMVNEQCAQWKDPVLYMEPAGLTRINR